MATLTQPTEHVDLFGKTITSGAVVAYARSNMLHIGIVGKMTKKMIKVNSINGYTNQEYLQYPENTILLEGSEITMYLLTHKR